MQRSNDALVVCDILSDVFDDGNLLNLINLQVALAMLKLNKPVNIGDHIPYVICAQVRPCVCECVCVCVCVSVCLCVSVCVSV